MYNWKHNYEKINLYLDKRISQEELANIMKFCKEDVFTEDEVNNVIILGDRKFYIDKIKTIADNYKVFIGLYE